MTAVDQFCSVEIVQVVTRESVESGLNGLCVVHAAVYPVMSDLAATRELFVGRWVLGVVGVVAAVSCFVGPLSETAAARRQKNPLSPLKTCEVNAVAVVEIPDRFDGPGRDGFMGGQALTVAGLEACIHVQQ